MSTRIGQTNRWAFALELFAKLRALECAAIATTCFLFEIVEQLGAGVFPQLPIATVMVPFGLYVGFGFLLVSLLAFLALVLFEIERTSLGLALLNTLPLALIGLVVQHAVFGGELPTMIHWAWLIALAVDIIAAPLVSRGARQD
jgi:hypothetical protein